MASDSLTGMLLGYVGTGIFVAVALVGSKLRDFLFPAGTFLIGDGKQRYERILFWRKSVLGLGVLLPLCVSVLPLLFG
jgi:hypothetical protein